MKKFLFGILGLLFAVPAVAATLPAGYTELEYIESTGTQIIVTDFVPTWEDTIEADYELTNLSATGDKFIMGGQPTSVQGAGFWVETYGNANAWYVRYGSNQSATTAFNSSQKSGTFILSKSSFVVNGTGILTPSADVQPVSPMSIFGRLDSNGRVSGGFVRFSNIRVKRSNVLTHNFVPAKNASGVIGMYDTVSGTLFTNAGTGTFTAGPDVVQTNTCPNGGTLQTYTSATGTVTQNGTPTLNAPVYPTFYTQGNMTLRKVGDVADSYDATTGIITRRVGEYVFTGNENIVFNYSVYGMTGIPYDHDAIITGTSNYQGFCSHAKTYTNGGSSMTGSARTFDKFFFFTNVDFVGFGSYETPSGITDAADVKQWLADQYNAGTPVTIWYPLKEANYTTEYVGTEWCEGIKIATTAYNTARFSPVVTELNDTIVTIRNVVTNTINQTKAIADLQATKQTRPDETCPAGKKCLLVEDDTGQPHWYEIIESAD